MIQVERLPIPDVLKKNASEWTRMLLHGTEDEKKAVEGNYGHKDIKSQLVAMFHGKCAYCESQIDHIDYGDIEHFKPKSKFKELTFAWENLLLACSICNRTHKKAQFPSPAEGGPLVDPSVENPSDFLGFVYDPLIQKAIVSAKNDRGKTTEETLGLNRRKLVRKRSLYIKKMMVLWEMREMHPKAAELVEKAKLSDSEYSAFLQNPPFNQ